MSALRGVWLLTMMGLGLVAGSARAEDFEAGKSAAKIFESDCVSCHRSPRGLAKGMGSRALVDFLREHYTTGLGPANELANYLQSGSADGDDRHATRSTGEPRDQHQRSQAALPPDADAGQLSSVRRHRHAGATAEPAAASEHDAAPPSRKRHHARTAEPTNAEPSANAQSPSADGQAAPAQAPLLKRESRHKHQRSPKAVEAAPSAKRRPDMTPTGATGPAGEASEPLQAETGSGKEPASAAAHGGEPDRAANAPAHARREAPADAGASGSAAAPAPPVSVHASQSGGAQMSEPPSAATGSSDQPAFSAPSP